MINKIYSKNGSKALKLKKTNSIQNCVKTGKYLNGA